MKNCVQGDILLSLTHATGIKFALSQ